MTKGFGTSTGKRKLDEHQVRQLAWTKFIAQRILPYKEHRQMLMSGPENTIPVFFRPSEHQLRNRAETETVWFPFGWNKNGKYPQNYLPIVTFSITEEEYMAEYSGKTADCPAFTRWSLHLYDTARNILTSSYWVGDDVHIGALNLDEGIEAPVPDDFTQFNNEFMEAFLIWMVGKRTVAA